MVSRLGKVNNMLYRKINDKGYFIKDVILDKQPTIMQDGEEIPDPHYVFKSPQGGLYQPKWNGNEWVEGKPQSGIDEIKAKQEAEKLEKKKFKGKDFKNLSSSDKDELLKMIAKDMGYID